MPAAQAGVTQRARQGGWSRARIAAVRGGDDVRRVYDDGRPDQAVLCFSAVVELGKLRLAGRAAELKSLRVPLERCGAVISRSLQVTAGEGHQHSSELVRWDQAYPGTGGTGADPSLALKDLLAAGVRASVVAPEPELRRWFSWQWYWTDALVDDLVREGRLRRVDGQVMMAGRG